MTSAAPPGAPGGLVLPGGTYDNPLAMGDQSLPPAVTLPLTDIRVGSKINLEMSRDTVAPITVVAEVDATNLQALRDWVKPAFEAQTNVPLTYLPFFARATALGLMAYPLMNSVLTEMGQIIPRFVHLGVAIQVQGGVTVPVLRNVETKDVGAIAQELHALAERARTGQLTLEETAGHSFVITNPGRWGATLFGTPIIKPPNVGILSFEAIVKRPVVVEGDQIAVRPMMYLALTADHRAVDGAEMLGFVAKVKDILENLRF